MDLKYEDVGDFEVTRKNLLRSALPSGNYRVKTSLAVQEKKLGDGSVADTTYWACRTYMVGGEPAELFADGARNNLEKTVSPLVSNLGLSKPDVVFLTLVLTKDYENSGGPTLAFPAVMTYSDFVESGSKFRAFPMAFHSFSNVRKDGRYSILEKNFPVPDYAEILLGEALDLVTFDGDFGLDNVRDIMFMKRDKW